MTDQVSFDVTDDEAALISDIVDRAFNDPTSKFLDRLELRMDITATHANGNPLRLEDLLHADNFNFFHDIYGINRHINRETGKLDNCFLPRFSRKDAA